MGGTLASTASDPAGIGPGTGSSSSTSSTGRGTGRGRCAGLVRPLVSANQGLLRITTRTRSMHDLLSSPMKLHPQQHTTHTIRTAAVARRGRGAENEWSARSGAVRARANCMNG